MVKSRIVVSASLLAALAAVPASADTLVIELNQEFSGAAAPAGTAPWARATFTDKGAGVVGLVLECLLQDSSEFMAKASGGAGNPKGWVFNLDSTLDPADLNFAHVSGTAASNIVGDSNAFKAGPDKFYDLVFQFGSGMVGGDVAEYDLTIGSGTLLASSFNVATTGGPAGKTGWLSAVHVQGIDQPSSGQGSSGWLGGVGSQAAVIPLPSAGALGLAGLGMVAARRRRVIA